jgi:hypothetical protein
MKERRAIFSTSGSKNNIEKVRTGGSCADAANEESGFRTIF